jgi:hypothetical protein
VGGWGDRGRRLRHSILVQDDGRWLLPLTVAGNRTLARGERSPTPPLEPFVHRPVYSLSGSLQARYRARENAAAADGLGELAYPGVQLYDPETGQLEVRRPS